MKYKIIYLEGRPHAHIQHRRLALAVSDAIDVIDKKMRWQDQGRGFLYNLYCWFINAYALGKEYSDASVLLVDNLHFTPVIINLLFPRRRKKLVVHLGSHTLYFIYTNRFSKINRRLHLWALSRYDVCLCEGKMSAEIARELLGKRTPRIFVTYLGVPAERFPLLQNLKPALDSTLIMIVASGPSLFRMDYKGLDVMINAFGLAAANNAQIQLEVFGTWDANVLNLVTRGLSDHVKSRIIFKGYTETIADGFSRAALCIHCARGDAFPTSTIESLAAGVPVFVSEWTGTREIIEQVDPSFILPLSAGTISEAILRYFETDLAQRQKISARCKIIATRYTEENALELYKKTFKTIIEG